MEIQKLLEQYKIGKEEKLEKSERAELVKSFVVKLNTIRRENGFRPLSAQFYAVKMAEAGLKTESDLYWFYKYCQESKHFGKCWWWSLKGKDQI